MLYAYIVLRNQCDHENISHLLLANPYINDHSKNTHCLFSQNDYFRLNTLLHGSLQLLENAPNLHQKRLVGFKPATLSQRGWYSST